MYSILSYRHINIYTMSIHAVQSFNIALQLLISIQFSSFPTSISFSYTFEKGYRFLEHRVRFLERLQYYTLRSSLHIQRSALLDDGTSRAHYLTPGRICCEGFYQNYSHSVFRLFIFTEYNFTISVISVHN